MQYKSNIKLIDSKVQFLFLKAVNIIRCDTWHENKQNRCIVLLANESFVESR
jgi:hypothetical protein